MELLAPLSSLAFGFLLGFIHAFDVDHLMAVSIMAQGKNKVSTYLQYSGRWALGHGLVLIILGTAFFSTGFELPEQASFWSEKLVGVLLLLFGLMLLIQLWYKSSLFNHHHKQTPFFVGVIHGIAGNAPVLALLPALSQTSLLAAVSYLCLFSIGLLVSMTLFAFTLSSIQQRLKGHQQWLKYSATSIGVASIAVGSIWLSP